jgi:outer membrane protein assembly factor BamD
MPRLRLLLALTAALGFLAPAVTRASLVWRPGEGWSDESGTDVSASSSRDQLELAHKLEAQGQRDDAAKAYKALLRRWPLSFFAPEAQFRLGKILEDTGDFYNAFQSFQKMVTKYPSSSYFEEGLGEQYRIANLYLAGEPQRVWKIPVGPSMDRTVEMYERIIKNAPYGTWAPQCQFKIGLAREHQRRFTDAVDSYQKVIDNYPTSSVAADAQYQIGYAWMSASRTGDYDMGAARKAIDAFQDYLVRYPTSDKADQAQENIQHLGQRQTQGAYEIAVFYEHEHPPDRRAAFIYYNEVIREDPNCPDAQKAKKRIQELRPLVAAMPGGTGLDGMPATIASGPAAPGAPGLDGNVPAASGAPNGDGNLPAGGPPAGPDVNAPVTPAPDGSTPAPLPGSAPGTNSGNPLDTPGASTAAPDAAGASTPGGAPSSPASTNAAPAPAPPDNTPLPQ